MRSASSSLNGLCAAGSGAAEASPLSSATAAPRSLVAGALAFERVRSGLRGLRASVSLVRGQVRLVRVRRPGHIPLVPGHERRLRESGFQPPACG